jgi:hypothetical protein
MLLGTWSGKLVCDDYSGYKALFERGVVEIGCMARARRKLHDLYANHRSDIAEEGLRYFAALYEMEREARELKLDAAGRHQLRQQRSKPVAEALRQWLTRQRGQVPDGSGSLTEHFHRGIRLEQEPCIVRTHEKNLIRRLSFGL